MSYSSSHRSLQFNDYRFGEQVDMTSTSPQSVSPKSSPQHSKSHSPNTSSLSPLQSTISQQQQYVQPLTRDMLEKKDRLDLLLQNRPTPGVRMIQRRRSISNGNIYRRLYNEDNSPITLAMPFTKMDSENSDASVHSPNSEYNVRYNRPFPGRHARHHRSEKRHHHQQQRHEHSVSYMSSSIDKTNRNDSNRDRSYGSITNKKQSTNSRSVNTSHASSSCHHPFNYHPRHPPDISGPPRRFSGLVRLSAAHIALNRTRKIKKRHYQSTMYIVLHKLKTIASRVVNSRISEPADTKMSIQELTSLSRYLYVLRHGYTKDDKSDSEQEDEETTQGASTPAATTTTPKHPIIGLFVQEEGEHSNRDQDTASLHESSPLLTSPSKRKRKRNLSSLGNIFPFAPLDRIPSLSRSGSESSQINTPAESDRLLPPLSSSLSRPQPSLGQSRMRCYLDTMIKRLRGPIRHFQQHQHQQEHNTQIRFEGWSLFFFSPTSLTRLYLWKVVGSR